MSRREEILQQIAEIARTDLAWEKPLSLDMRLVEDLDLDSVRLLTLAVAVEDHFRVALDEEDEAEIATVGDLVAVVEAKLEGERERA